MPAELSLLDLLPAWATSPISTGVNALARRTTGDLFFPLERREAWRRQQALERERDTRTQPMQMRPDMARPLLEHGERRRIQIGNRSYESD